MKLTRLVPPMLFVAASAAVWRAITTAAEKSGVIIVGAGNSGNQFAPPDPTRTLAAALAALPDQEPISPDELAAAYAAIRRRAAAGEVDAALVLFQIARRQDPVS